MGEDEKNEEPDFSAFADWHVVEQEEEWPLLWTNIALSENQKTIVQRNARLLLDKENLHNRVISFESELAKISDEEERKKKRAEFCLHFNEHDFSQENKDFTKYQFPCSICFDNAQFGEGDVSFDNAQFGEGNVSFNNAQFGKGDVYFNNAQFGEGNVYFDDAQFDEGNVYFNNAQFGEGYVSFDYAQFGEGYVSFDDAQFGEGYVSFYDAQFGKGFLSFYNAQFGKGDVYFDKLNLEKTNIHFAHIIFKSSFFMRNVLFPQKAEFHSLTFKGPAFLSGCKFKKTPNFRDTTFERPIEISNIEIPPTEMNSSWLFPKAIDKEDVHKYRKLKSMAQDTHDHIMEGYFFAQEMRAKRGVEITSFGELLLNELYYVFSNYGQSYWRPLIGLFSSFAAFMVFYFLLLLFFIKPISALLFAAEYSLRHTLPFIGTFLRFSPYPPDHPSWFSETLHHLAHEGAPLGWMAYIGLTQSILGLILLFLLALGLRNAFRMK